MRKAILLILDGAGYSTDLTGNAVTAQTMPKLFGAMERHGFALLGASETAVGLEPKQVGNSEAGHLNIGAGRVVSSMSQRILKSTRDGEWGKDPAWKKVVDARVLHVVGLLSSAGVHAFDRTLTHAAEVAAKCGVERIVIHPILDGVDAPAGSAPALLEKLKTDVAQLKKSLGDSSQADISLGVVLGRKNFCDRGGNLDMSRAAADPLTGKLELPTFTAEALQKHLADNPSELSFPPHRFEGATIAAGEPVLITSHRADRARQMATVLSETQPVYMMVHAGDDVAVEHVFFPQDVLTEGVAYELKKAGIRSLRIAEKAKFPHITFFFNGFDASAEGEGICHPSVLEAEIAAHPEMSIEPVTEDILTRLADPKERAIVVNLVNLDQVGHLGRLDLATRAAEVVDASYARIVERAHAHGWTVITTADHGNADCVEDAEGKPFGSHTDRQVPFIVQPPVGITATWQRKEGVLANIGATFLGALGLTPPEVDGASPCHLQWRSALLSQLLWV